MVPADVLLRFIHRVCFWSKRTKTDGRPAAGGSGADQPLGNESLPTAACADRIRCERVARLLFQGGSANQFACPDAQIEDDRSEGDRLGAQELEPGLYPN